MVSMQRQVAGFVTELSIGDSEAVRSVINTSNRCAYRAVIPAEHFRDEVLPATVMPELFERMTFFGYWDEDQLAGVAALERTSEDSMQMRWVYVLPTHQRIGVGTALVKHLEGVASSADIVEMKLRTTEGADWAISFYRKLGYRVTGRVPRPWGADIWMQKSLRPAN